MGIIFILSLIALAVFTIYKTYGKKAFELYGIIFAVCVLVLCAFRGKLPVSVIIVSLIFILKPALKVLHNYLRGTFS